MIVTLVKFNIHQISANIKLFFNYALKIIGESSEEKTLDNVTAYILFYVKNHSSDEELDKIPEYITSLMKRSNHLLLTVNTI